MRTDIDGQIVHALHVDGRASFRAIADVVGVSPQTVNRRYADLCARHSLRVWGATDPLAVGDEQWFLRVQAAPGSIDDIAGALARHEETGWVQIASGRTEIVCTIRHPEGAEPRLLRSLSRTARLTSVTAHCLLHTYFGDRQGLLDKVGPLTPTQVDALRVPGRSLPASPPDALDRAILGVLHRHGRAGTAELARTAGCSVSTAQRRVAELRDRGVLYFEVGHDLSLLPRHRSAALWVSVAPSALDRAGRALAAHPEVAFAASTTGPTNLYAALSCADNRALHTYLTGPLAELPGLLRVESAPITSTVKYAHHRQGPDL